MRPARLLFGNVLLLALPWVASAQAWLPDQGSGSVSIQYQNGFVRDHAFGSTQVDAGHIESHGVIADVVYAVTDRVAVRFSLPYFVAKYDGSKPHNQIPGLPNLDNGRYHGAVQDLRLDVRYAISPHHAIAVTPFVTTIVPSHQYTYFAHSAVGTDLNELQVGSYVARALDPILPQFFVQGRVAYGFVQKMLGISHNRTYLDLEFGYAVRPGVRVFVLGTGYTTHGGLAFPAPPVKGYDYFTRLGGIEYWRHHDQINHEQTANLGVGGAVAITHTLDLFGSIGTNMMEVNGHVVARGVSAGVTWHFSRDNGLGELREEPRKMAARCVCGTAR
jgi:hypothetical protein